MAEQPTTEEHPIETKEEDLPRNLRELVNKALGAVEMKNYKYTISLMQNVLREAPGYVDGRKMLRSSEVALVGGKKKKSLFGGGGLGTMKLASVAKKDPLGALDAIEKELEKDPYNSGANELLFETALKLNFLETAAFALETIRSGAPENTKLLHKLAEFYLSRELPERAAGVYRDICKQDVTDTAAVKGEKDATARASMQKQRNAKGEYVLGKKDEAETLAVEKAARAALTKDQLEEKAAALVEVYEQDPNNVAVVKDLAATYEKMEDWRNAHTFYDWAHQISSGDVALKSKAAFMKDKAADHQLKGLEASVEENPDDQDARQKLDEVRAARIAEQVDERRRRVEQNPTDPQLRFDLGQALYHAGDFSGAIPHLQQATRNPHIRTKVLLLLGRTFDAKGMHDLAVKQLSDANTELMAMDATKKEILYELGIIHDKQGKKDAALDAFKQIYEVDYGYRDVAARVEGSYRKRIFFR
ncbi:MAG: hypothetical protein O3A87_02470 [Verrucomicrobia bacterium]|nr:hypothetical protein [Verrucomicrobiota bacterium]MDA1005333.1 hypothetical protein [Verrucomicrobiota bacterium]